MKRVASIVSIMSWMLLMINLFVTVGVVCINYSKTGLDMSQHLLMISTSADNGGMVYHTLTYPESILKDSSYSEEYAYTVGESSDVHIGVLDVNRVMKDTKTGETFKPKEYKIRGVYIYTDRFINTILWVSLIASIVNWVCGKRARKQLTKTKRFSIKD